MPKRVSVLQGRFAQKICMMVLGVRIYRQFSSVPTSARVFFFVFARAPRTENKFGGAGGKNRRFYRPEWIRAGRTAQVNGEPGLYHRMVET